MICLSCCRHGKQKECQACAHIESLSDVSRFNRTIESLKRRHIPPAYPVKISKARRTAEERAKKRMQRGAWFKTQKGIEFLARRAASWKLGGE